MRTGIHWVRWGLPGLFLASVGAPIALSGQTTEVIVRVPPTMWTVSADNPPCQLQVYIGRVNTTQEAASCRRVCVPNASTFTGRLRKFSRDEEGTWQEGAVPWAAWEDSTEQRGCAVFKNWSHNRFREAKIVVDEIQ